MREKRKNTKPAGKHHPFCVITYQRRKREGRDWRCSCKLLKAYDKWRRKKEFAKELNFVMKDDEDILRKLSDKPGGDPEMEGE